jgi:hypothetical protein
MEILAIILIVYGALLLFGFLLQIPLIYNNPKSKVFIKMMGKKGFNILIIIMGLASLIIGIILL